MDTKIIKWRASPLPPNIICLYVFYRIEPKGIRILQTFLFNQHVKRSCNIKIDGGNVDIIMYEDNDIRSD